MDDETFDVDSAQALDQRVLTQSSAPGTKMDNETFDVDSAQALDQRKMDEETLEANAQVLEVLNKMLALMKTQMMRDCYTTEFFAKLQAGTHTFESLNDIINMKLEDNRAMDIYLNELVVLLKKPRQDGLVVPMSTDSH